MRLLVLLMLAWFPRTVHGEEAEATTGSVAPRSQGSALWQRQWPTFSVAEGVGTVTAAAAIGAFVLLKPPQKPNWQGGILFDDGLRKAIRLRLPTARDKARSFSELPFYAAPAIPLVIDPLVLWLARGDGKAAVNVELMGLEAFSYAGVLSYVSNDIAQRQRPDATACHDSGMERCSTNTDSFYSGHTTIVAASAGLVCANHVNMPIYGNRVADLGTCALATTGAVASGVARLMGDQHYTTDVLVGFGMGFGIGYGLPTLLHYTRSDSSDVSLSISPGAPCTGACLKLGGSF